MFRLAVRRLSAQAAQATKPSQVVDAVKIEQLSVAISKLTLVETSQLVDNLKQRLGVTDAMMSVQAAPVAQAAAPQSEAAVEKKAEAPKKTKFTLKLVKIDAAQKAKVIREIKNLVPNINLVEAKKFVESAPKTVKENISQEECDKIKAALEAVGAEVKVE